MNPVGWAIGFGVTLLFIGHGPANAEQELFRFVDDPTVEGFQELESIYDLRIREMRFDDLVALERSMEESLFLDTVKVYFPYLLPREFPGRLVYFSCFVELNALVEDLTNPRRFSDYHACLDYGFNGHLPANYVKLLAALKVLSHPAPTGAGNAEWTWLPCEEPSQTESVVSGRFTGDHDVPPTRLILSVDLPDGCTLRHEGGEPRRLAVDYARIAALCRDPLTDRDHIVVHTAGGGSGCCPVEIWSVDAQDATPTRLHSEPWGPNTSWVEGRWSLRHLVAEDGTCLWRERR